MVDVRPSQAWCHYLSLHVELTASFPKVLNIPGIGKIQELGRNLAIPPDYLTQPTRLGISERNLLAATTPRHPLDITADPSTYFTCFLRLPPEIQLAIIGLALLESRCIRLSYPRGRRCRGCRRHLNKKTDMRGPSPSAIMQVNQLFRYEALKVYPLSFPLFIRGAWTQPQIRFNFRVDTLIIPQHIVDEKETLPDEDWKRLQRVGIICEDDFRGKATKRMELLKSVTESIKIFPWTHPCAHENEWRHYSIPFSMDYCIAKLENLLSESPIKNKLHFEYWTEENTHRLMQMALPPMPSLSLAVMKMRASMYHNSNLKYLILRNSELSAT
ncbi:hypothetical protein B7494_g526 [Chlorociboria aeruginascens]|nr:hypothetical protein B7494_g526 [Chlorociboria aeruginascens]